MSRILIDKPAAFNENKKCRRIFIHSNGTLKSSFTVSAVLDIRALAFVVIGLTDGNPFSVLQ